MPMKRIDGYIRTDQFYFLTSTTGTLSEHIRRALDMYIESLKPTATTSESKERRDNG